VIVGGRVCVEVGGREVGRLAPGECFGETSYVPEAKRTATIRASDAVTLMRVSATLLETSSASCQLRFNKVFLRSLIRRLQGSARAART
jgi:CRP-like cAMP-binding protein